MSATTLNIPDGFRLLAGHLPVSSSLPDTSATIPFMEAVEVPCPHGKVYMAVEDTGLLAVTGDCDCAARESFTAALRVAGLSFSHCYTEGDGETVEFYRDGNPWDVHAARREASPDLLRSERVARNEQVVSATLRGYWLDDLAVAVESGRLEDPQPVEGCPHGTVHGLTNGIATMFTAGNTDCDYWSCEAVQRQALACPLSPVGVLDLGDGGGVMFLLGAGQDVEAMVTDWLCKDLDG